MVAHTQVVVPTRQNGVIWCLGERLCSEVYVLDDLFVIDPNSVRVSVESKGVSHCSESGVAFASLNNEGASVVKEKESFFAFVLWCPLQAL